MIASVDALPVCMTQGNSFEETRELLIDAIAVWILSAIKDGDSVPVVNVCRLAITGTQDVVGEKHEHPDIGDGDLVATADQLFLERYAREGQFTEGWHPNWREIHD